MHIWTNADTLSRPKKNDDETFKNSMKKKTTMNGKGPRKAWQILPDDREATMNWKAQADIAWISAITYKNNLQRLINWEDVNNKLN